MSNERFEFGDVVKDVITERSGTVTGRTTYITGCDQYLVQPPEVDDDKKKVEAFWMDVDRLEKVSGPTDGVKRLLERVKVTTGPGPDAPAPIK